MARADTVIVCSLPGRQKCHVCIVCVGVTLRNVTSQESRPIATIEDRCGCVVKTVEC